MLQEEQLEAVQPAQELPPTGADIPFSSVAKQANREGTRLASLLQMGQGAGSAARLTGRIFSNFRSQSVQTYSYSGIFSHHHKSMLSPAIRQASQTTSPSLMVISTRMFLMASGGQVVGSSLSNTMSASFPGVIEPLMSSSKEAQAAPMV